MGKSIRRVQAILKVVERCNLACSYCYYFEGGDQSFKNKPAVMSIETMNLIGQFLAQGVKDLNLESVSIAFHGGEPLLLKPNVLDSMCTSLRTEIEPVCRLTLSAQTNGTHLTEQLLSVIAKHRIEVAVSIDGLAAAHDRERKYHSGQGSYKIVARNFSVLKQFAATRGLGETHILSVLDARNDYVKTINGLVDELGAQHFNFLLPDCSHDDGIPHGFAATDYGRSLCEIFTAWVKLETITVREIDLLLRRFQLAKEDTTQERRPAQRGDKENQIIVIRSDGELQIDDTFIPASHWRNQLPKIHVSKVSLQDYLRLPVFQEIESIYNRTPDGCSSCCWKNICNGGDIENRYSKEKGFNNPSVYCDGLKMLYRKVARYLRANGYPADVLRDRLKPSNGKHKYRFSM